jgi:hypothetical protein
MAAAPQTENGWESPENGKGLSAGTETVGNRRRYEKRIEKYFRMSYNDNIRKYTGK